MIVLFGLISVCAGEGGGGGLIRVCVGRVNTCLCSLG